MEYLADQARILIYGDPHLCSKNYGAHVDYASESLNLFKKITDIAIEQQATMLVGLGDFSYGRFHTLEYREAVENELQRQYGVVQGSHYQLKGNHDKASYGMTEYEYYIKKGLLKPSCNIQIGNVNITMVDYGLHTKTEPNISTADGATNVILAHDYFRFSNSPMPNMGKFVELDNFSKWFGVDYIISGHIHTQYIFEGDIIKQDNGIARAHHVIVQYPGSLPRPAYTEGHMDLEGRLVLLVIDESGNLDYQVITIDLPDLAESFNLSQKAIEAEKKLRKEQRVDISDIIKKLDSHNRTIGNPEDIINAMGVPEKYKVKAIELLKASRS